MGIAVSDRSRVVSRGSRVVCALFAFLLGASQTIAAERYALIVSGANGDASYADQYATWRQSLVSALRDHLKVGEQHLDTLFDGGEGSHAATAAGVRNAVDGLRARLHADDLLLIFMIGHGTFDGQEAKFNLVGPDLSGAEWAALLKPLPARLVIVDATAASFPYLERLAGPRRIVITATDSPAQRFDTVFPEYFIKALTDPGADIDKNGRVSIWEAFLASSLAVRRYYEQRGQLATERALLDDNGDGVGREAGADGDDGSVASRSYFDEEVVGAAPTDEELLALLQKRATLEIDVADLKQRHLLMTPDDYQKEFERLMIELARVSRDIRRKQKT
jgi:chorismate mutase